MSTQSAISTSKKITITLPTVNLAVLSKKVIEYFAELFSSFYNPLSNKAGNVSEGIGQRARRVRFPEMSKFKFNFNKKTIRLIFPIILGLIVVAAIVNVVRSLPDAKSKQETGSTKLSVPDALATINLEKKFDFPLKDEKGKTVGTFEYVIQSAQLQNQIIVQGQRATAVSGKVFLILNLKITNNLKQMIQLNTRDYLRLVVTSNDSEQLAPDIHNDPVEVQAISTKYTRVGIALDEVDIKKNVQLKVGEIDGEKQNIDLKFNY